MLHGDKVKAVWPLRAITLKRKAMITGQCGERQASLKPALGLLYLAFLIQFTAFD